MTRNRSALRPLRALRLSGWAIGTSHYAKTMRIAEIDLDLLHRHLLVPHPRRCVIAARLGALEIPMQDVLWIAAMIGLVAATLAYVRLCDNA